MQSKQRLELVDYEAENLARLQKIFARKWEFVYLQADAQARYASCLNISIIILRWAQNIWDLGKITIKRFSWKFIKDVESLESMWQLLNHSASKLAIYFVIIIHISLYIYPYIEWYIWINTTCFCYRIISRTYSVTLFSLPGVLHPRSVSTQ